MQGFTEQSAIMFYNIFKSIVHIPMKRILGYNQFFTTMISEIGYLLLTNYDMIEIIMAT